MLTNPAKVSKDTFAKAVVSLNGSKINFKYADIKNNNFLVEQPPATYAEYAGASQDPMSYYAIQNGTVMTYDQAKSACEAVGGQLPTFHSTSEYSDLQRYRWAKREMGLLAQVEKVWIGLRRIDSSSVFWTWPNFSMDNYNWSWWKSGQPKNDASILCAASVINNVDDSMSWLSTNCSDTFSVICQIRSIPISNRKPSYTYNL